MGWLTGWDVRKKHTLTGSVAGAQSDYQLRFEVHYGAGVDAGEVVYCDSKCRTDFGDIRFTAADGFTELDYWIEEQTDGVNAIIWVEVPSILADPATTDIYIYYGNAGAATTSSGDDTFILWNDCDDVGEWTVDNIRAGPTWGTTVIDGVTTIYLFSTGDTDRLRLRFNTANSRRENSRFFSRIKHTEFQTDSYFIYYLGRQPVTSLNHDYIYYGSFYDVYKTTAVVNGVGGTDEYDVGHPNGWYRYEGTVNSDGKLTIHRDVTELGTYTQDGDYADAHPMFHVSQFAEQGAVRIYVDYFAVGKYVDPEPTHTSWGPEVSGGIKSVFAKFVVKQWQEDLAAEFVVRYGKENLPAEFMIKQETSVDLLGEFVVRHDGIPVDLLGEFVVSRSVPSALVLGPQNVATATYWALAWPFQRKVWHRAGRHWVFYEHDDQLRYVSSVDGVTWDGPTDIRSCRTSSLFGTWVDDNGYLHYVYCRDASGRTMKYRRGLLESDGTITWSAVEQDASTVYAETQWLPSVCVDDAGYPWLTWTRGKLYGPRDQMVSKSSTNDGTWVTAPNYPVEIYPPSYLEITPNITPIANGKAFVTRTGGNETRIRGWLCDDDGPGARQTQDLPSDVTGEYGITTIVSLGDTAWVAIDTDDGTYVAKYQDGNWVGVVQVDAAGTWPPITFMVGGLIYVAWLQIEGGGAPNSWMRRISMDGGTTWGASGVLLYAPGGVSRGYYANFAPHLESPLGFAWLHPHPGLAIYYGWLDVVSAPELICSFNVGQDVGELKATFAIRRIGTPQNLHAVFELQISVDLLGEFVVNNSGSAELLGKFGVRQDSIDLPVRFEVGQDSAELLGKFEAQAVAELLGKFEAQVTAELLGRFDVGQGSAELLALFLIPRAYDFSGGMGISFDWWGSGGVDQNIDFEMWSLTGGWVGRFPDGPAEWRQVQLSWDDLTPVDLDGTRPDSSQIIGIYWTYHTPGVRRIDGIRAWMRQNLLCKVIIRDASTSKLLGKFEAQATADLFGKADIIHFTDLFSKAEVGQNSAELSAQFDVGQDSAELLSKVNITHSADLLGRAEVRQSDSAELLGKADITH